MAERLLSVHIPKTGGISLLKFWMDLYGCENVYQHHTRRGFIRSDQLPGAGRLNPKAEKIKKVLFTNPYGQKIYPTLRTILHALEKKPYNPNPPEDFAIIHGHFQPDELVLPNTKFVTVMREPLDRAMSNYVFWISMYKKGDKMPAWFSDKTSFREFVGNSEQINFQATYLNGRGLDSFAHVGVTEDLEGYSRIFDPEGKVILQKLNKAVIATPFIEPDLVEEFKEANKIDYALYQNAKLRSIIK